MEFLITGGAFLGAILGRFFKVLVLVPVSIFAAALLLARCGFAGLTVFDSLLLAALMILSLELGYVTGLLSTDLSAGAQSFGKCPPGPRHRAPSRRAHLG